MRADGWVSFPDGPAVRVEGLTSVPPGPVLAPERTSNGGPYRDASLLAENLVAGTHAEHAAATQWEVLRHEATVLAIASLAAAPLVAAGLVGLVW